MYPPSSRGRKVALLTFVAIASGTVALRTRWSWRVRLIRSKSMYAAVATLVSLTFRVAHIAFGCLAARRTVESWLGLLTRFRARLNGNPASAFFESEC